MRLIQIVMVVALLALGAGLVVRGLMAPDRPVSQALLPEFEFPDISDKKHSSSEWQGKIRVINFWATWCPPCIKEIPEFVELQTQLGDKGVQFIGIAIEDKVPVEQYLAINTVNYPLLVADFAGNCPRLPRAHAQQSISISISFYSRARPPMMTIGPWGVI